LPRRYVTQPRLASVQGKRLLFNILPEHGAREANG
jgi:hypothetical protein